jgi:hypothetical protein
MKPDSYKLANCCATCKYEFNITHCDGTSDSFCHYDNSKRPLHPYKCFDQKDDKVFIKQLKKWDKWSIPREVSPWGTCKLYKNYQEK